MLSLSAWLLFLALESYVRMEDSGNASYSSPGSVDLSLDALEISSPNDSSASASSCESSEVSSVTPASTQSQASSNDLMPDPSIVSEIETFGPDSQNVELQK